MLPWVNFFGNLWASWTSWKYIFFARLGKFSIIFSGKFSISCSSSFPSGILMIWMLERFKLSQRFLSLSFFKFLSLHFVLVECLFLSSAPNRWFESRLPSLHCWFPVHLPLFHFLWPSLFLFCDHIQPFLWASWLPVFWTLHLIDRLAISSLLSCIFSGALICSLGCIFLSRCTCYVLRGRALDIC